MSGRIRDKFPKKKKTRSVTVRVNEDLYLSVMKELRKSKHTFVEFIEASIVSFLEEIQSENFQQLSKPDEES